MPDAATSPPFHPLAGNFPLMEDEQFENLVADIKAHGQLVPIVMLNGLVLDGRNRWRACKEAGVEPKTEEFAGGDPLDFVLTMNAQRRHLTTSQRAMIAARMVTTKPGDNQHTTRTEKVSQDLPDLPRVSRKEAGLRLSVGDRYVTSALYVLKHGTAAEVEEVDLDKNNLAHVEQTIRHRLNDAERRRRTQAKAGMKESKRVETVADTPHTSSNPPEADGKAPFGPAQKAKSKAAAKPKPAPVPDIKHQGRMPAHMFRFICAAMSPDRFSSPEEKVMAQRALDYLMRFYQQPQQAVEQHAEAS